MIAVYSEEECQLNDPNIFIPWTNASYHTQNPKLNHTYKQKQFYLKRENNPFFAVVNEDCTVEFFMDIVLKDGYDDGNIYISKKFVHSKDHEEIKQLLQNIKSYKYLINVSFDKATKTKVKSILLTDKEYKIQNIVSVYLVNEPDRFSKWKICMMTKD